MKGIPPPFRVASPCPKQWSQLPGTDQRRFCGQCQLHVHNLSEMSERERERFARESGGRGCITYEQLPDGSMRVPSRPDWMPRFLYRLGKGLAAALVALLPFVFTSCAAPARNVTGGMLPPPGYKGRQPDAERCRTIVTGGI